MVLLKEQVIPCRRANLRQALCKFLLQNTMGKLPPLGGAVMYRLDRTKPFHLDSANYRPADRLIRHD